MVKYRPEVEDMSVVLAIVLSYLFGSIPWGLVIGQVFFHKDIRKEGSGNSGGTNAGRVLGKPIGVLVIALDALKGFISMCIAHYIAPGTEIYAGLACCIGHCFPIFAGFHGGKAVATSYGFFLGITLFVTHTWFYTFALPILAFFIILFFSRMVSFSSMSALWITAIASLILYFNHTIGDIAVPVSLLLLACFVTYRHKANIKRIINHEESHIQWMGRAPWEK